MFSFLIKFSYSQKSLEAIEPQKKLINRQKFSYTKLNFHLDKSDDRSWHKVKNILQSNPEVDRADDGRAIWKKMFRIFIHDICD